MCSIRRIFLSLNVSLNKSSFSFKVSCPIHEVLFVGLKLFQKKRAGAGIDLIASSLVVITMR